MKNHHISNLSPRHQKSWKLVPRPPKNITNLQRNQQNPDICYKLVFVHHRTPNACFLSFIRPDSYQKIIKKEPAEKTWKTNTKVQETLSKWAPEIDPKSHNWTVQCVPFCSEEQVLNFAVCRDLFWADVRKRENLIREHVGANPASKIATLQKKAQAYNERIPHTPLNKNARHITYSQTQKRNFRMKSTFWMTALRWKQTNSPKHQSFSVCSPNRALAMTGFYLGFVEAPLSIISWCPGTPAFWRNQPIHNVMACGWRTRCFGDASLAIVKWRAADALVFQGSGRVQVWPFPPLWPWPGRSSTKSIRAWNPESQTEELPSSGLWKWPRKVAPEVTP